MNKKPTNLPAWQANGHQWQVLVLILKKIAEKKGISQQEIANITGLQRSNINRMFALRYCPTLKNFIAIARAIEVNFFFEDRQNKTDLNAVFEAAMTELGRRAEKLPKN